MTSSENLASIEPWAFRHQSLDPWISDAFTRDTETLTRALQKSLSSPNPESTDTMSPFLSLIKPDSTTAPPTPTVSGLSGGGSEPEMVQRRQRNMIPVSAGSGKVSKRKSRASKRSQTTFITADAANFRQMVQQVTGVRFGNGSVPMVPILKPEPQRPGSRLQGGGPGCLPTLDTSAFLLDHHQQQIVGPNSASTIGVLGAGGGGGSGLGGSGGPLSFGPNMGLADGGVSGGGFDFDTFATSFPTLESWKVM